MMCNLWDCIVDEILDFYACLLIPPKYIRQSNIMEYYPEDSEEKVYHIGYS